MVFDWLWLVFSANVHLFWSTFVFAQTLSLSGFIPRVPPQQPGYFHLRCQPDASTRWKKMPNWIILKVFGFEFFESNISSLGHSNMFQSLIDNFLFSIDGQQCFCPKATSEGGNLLLAHKTYQPLWRHWRRCIWQGRVFLWSTQSFSFAFNQENPSKTFDHFGDLLN